MRLGIVGTGKIVHTALEIIQDQVQIDAIYGRDEQKVTALQKQYQIPKGYTDYSFFLNDPSIDTVYIGLINSLHASFAKEALLAGKHVILEKPFTITYQQAKELVDLAKKQHVYLFEAILSRYSKNLPLLKEAVQQIGQIKLVQANFSQYSSRYDHYRNGIVDPAFDPAYCGGSLYDINVYNIHLLIALFGMPETVQYYANVGFNGIDTSGILVMQYPSWHAQAVGAKDSASYCGVMIQGEDGWIEMRQRPGFIQEIYLKKPKFEGETKIDRFVEIPMLEEFKMIEKVIEEQDDMLVEQWLNDTLAVMKVLEKAKADMGNPF